MTQLMIHTRGSHTVEKNDLKLIPIPEPTESYQPVSHYDLANSLATIGQDLLTGYYLKKERYGLARQGKQMFAVLTFAPNHPVQGFAKNNDDMGLSIGFRNSYDKSMAIGIAIGANVFVCDNLAMTGDIAVMKKHTANVLTSLEDTAITVLYRSQYTFKQIVHDSHQLKARHIENDQAFKLIGLLFGHGLLSPRQLPVVKSQWLKPTHPEFADRTLWSFYNACTEALKSAPPLNIMEKHITLHKTLSHGRELWQ